VWAYAFQFQGKVGDGLYGMDLDSDEDVPAAIELDLGSHHACRPKGG
jgi:hypothetical protein